MNNDEKPLIGPITDLITNEDGSATDAIGVPSMLITRNRDTSRWDEEESFATEMKRRFDAAQNHYK